MNFLKKMQLFALWININVVLADILENDILEKAGLLKEIQAFSDLESM